MSALPGMQPPKGLNVESLFAEDIRDPMDRIRRVENVVLDLRRDFNTIMPSIMRLVAVEDDMQNLIGQLQTLTETPPAVEMGPLPPPQAADFGTDFGLEKGADPTGTTQHPPVAQAGRAEDSQPPPQTAPPPASSADLSPSESDIGAMDGLKPPIAASVSAPVEEVAVKDIRISAHPDKTRIVLALDRPIEVQTFFDEGKKRLVVDLPGARWLAPAQGTSSDPPLIDSWVTEPLPAPKGTRLILTLKAAASLSPPLSIPPLGGQDPRLALDLKASP